MFPGDTWYERMIAELSFVGLGVAICTRAGLPGWSFTTRGSSLCDGKLGRAFASSCRYPVCLTLNAWRAFQQIVGMMEGISLQVIEWANKSAGGVAGMRQAYESYNTCYLRTQMMLHFL